MTHPTSVSVRRYTMTLVLGAVVACQSSGTPAPSTNVVLDTTAIRASIDSLAANVMRAHETGDAELFASTWARDGIMSNAGAAPIVGRDSIVAAFRRLPPLPPGARMTIHPTEMQIQGPEWAYVFGVDTLTLGTEAGAPPVHQTFTFMVILRKTSEGWQSYREVLSPNQ